MSFVEELKRRNVFKVAVLYVVAAWLILQVADVLFPNLGAPEWAFGLVLGLLILFFFPVLIFSWVYELTPEGLRREKEVDRSQSVTHETGRKINVLIVVMLALAISVVVVDRLIPETDRPFETESIDELEKTATAESSELAARKFAGPPVIAVLPFKAAGSDDGGFLAGGLHDDLLSRLAQLDAFRVISRTSMMEYAGTSKNMRQIGDELGAGYILEGGVQAMGNRVRINAQLIDAAADEHVWAEIYDRDLTAQDLFDIQAELASAIAVQMQTVLTDADRELLATIPTQNTEAYSAYLRGLELSDRGGMGEHELLTALAAFEQAASLDPEFALAWAHVSIQQSSLAQITHDTAFGEPALAALERARELQPNLAEVRLARAVYLYRVLFEYEQALQALEAPGENNSLDASALTLKAYLLRRVGRIGEAYQAALKAQKLDPRSVNVATSLIITAYENDDCASAEEHARGALALAPQAGIVRTYVANYELECTGDAERASELLAAVDLRTADPWALWTAREAALLQRDFERVLELSAIAQPGEDPFNDVFDRLYRAVALWQLDREEELTATLDQVLARLVELEQSPRRERAAYAAARRWYHALRGDPDETRYWIMEHRRRFAEEEKGDKADEATNRLGYAADLTAAGLYDEAIVELRVMLEEPGGHRFRYIDANPIFDSIRQHPGYIELRERFRNAR